MCDQEGTGSNVKERAYPEEQVINIHDQRRLHKGEVASQAGFCRIKMGVCKGEDIAGRRASTLDSGGHSELGFAGV